MLGSNDLRNVLEERINLRQSTINALDTPDGKRLLRYLLKIAGLTKPRIITDPNLLLVRQGQQHIVLTILNIMGQDPDQLLEQIEQSLQQQNQL